MRRSEHDEPMDWDAAPMAWNATINEPEWELSVPELFAEVRSRVSAMDAGRFYGLDVSDKGWTRCIYHADEHASMKLYENDGRHSGFYCYSCKKAGDVTELVGKILGLSPMDALRQLDDDFRLHLPLKKRPLTPAEAEARAKRERLRKAAAALEAWRKSEVNRLNELIQMANNLPPTPDAWTPEQVDALRHREQYEAQADFLQSATPAELLDAYRQAKAKVGAGR